MKQRNFLPRTRISPMQGVWLIGLIILMIFMPVNAYSGTIELSKTGQTTCYDETGAVVPCAGTGQDGEFQEGVDWLVPRFTVNPDGTVTDTLTGLVWLEDGGCFGNSNWQTALNNIASLNAGTNFGCQNYTAGTYTDWRVPNILELESLVHYGFNEAGNCGGGCASLAAWLNDQGFTGFSANNYWVTTTYGDAANGATTVSMASGVITQWQANAPAGGSKNITTPRVIPVRGTAIGSGTVDLSVTGENRCWVPSWSADPDCDPTNWGPISLQDAYFVFNQPPGPVGVEWPTLRFIDNYNDTMTDIHTGLLWTKSGNPPKSENPNNAVTNNWQDALDWVADMNAGLHDNYGYTDWRMANNRELLSILRWRTEHPGNWLASQGFENVHENGSYWSSTTDPTQPGNAFTIDYIDLMISASKDNPASTCTFWDPQGCYFWPVRDSTALPWILGVGILPEGGGSVTGTDFNCPPDCEESYMVATSGIVLTVTAYEGSTFDFWTGCDSTNGNVCTVSVDGKTRGVAANFKVPDIRIVPNAVSFGNVDVVGSYADKTITLTSYESSDYQAATASLPSSPFSIEIDNCSGKNFIAPPVQTNQENLDDGDNVSTSFPGPYTANNTPLIPGTVAIWWLPVDMGWQTVTDTCECGLFYKASGVDGGGVTGEVDYATGEISNLVFETPPRIIVDNNGNPKPDKEIRIKSYTYGTRDSCTIDVRFTPTSEGTSSDTFGITGLKTITLRGTGTSAEGPVPDIFVSPNNMSFLNTAPNTDNDKTLTVTNYGDDVLNIGAIAITGDLQFSLIGSQDNCSGQPVAASGGTCTVGVRYTAGAAPGGPRIASLSIPSDDTDENPLYVGLMGSSIKAGNTPPTRPVLVSPVNGDTGLSSIRLKWEDGEDSDICIDVDNPPGCDDTQTLTNTLYLATDPAFQNLVIPVANLDDSGVTYAMVFGNPIALIALFGIIAIGVFLKRKKIAFLIVAVVFAGGLLLGSCGGGGTGGAAAVGVTGVQAGTYYWKVVADDDQGGVRESDTWSFTTSP